MATVMFCWELGGGLGHVMQMLPLAADLVGRGHRVFMALRILDHAAAGVLGRIGVGFLQAPAAPARPDAAPAVGYAQLLSGCGFGDAEGLFLRACAWRSLLRFTRPDLLVFDHAPTALLAARALPEARRALIGSGFCVPPGHEEKAGPWAALRPDAAPDAREEAIAEQRRVLDRANRVLAQWKCPPLRRLGELYADVDETFLTTFPELDHFGARPGAVYWGPVLSAGAGPAAGDAPAWPPGGHGRVFAYLKRNPVTRDVIEALKRSRWTTIAYVEGLSAAGRARVEATNLRVAPRRVDVARAAAECDLAVVNGGHGVVAEMLLAGRPVLAVPLNLEQQMTGEAVARLGAGEAAPPESVPPESVPPESVPTRRVGGRRLQWTGDQKLAAMLRPGVYADAARDFSKRHSDFDRSRQRRDMLGRAEELLADGRRVAPGRDAPAAAAVAKA